MCIYVCSNLACGEIFAIVKVDWRLSLLRMKSPAGIKWPLAHHEGVTTEENEQKDASIVE